MEQIRRASLRHLLLLASCAALLCTCASQVSADSAGGLCVSQGIRFPKFSLEGHAPGKASKGKIDLKLCRFYRKKTCCDVVQTHAAVVNLQKLATSGEAASKCLELWEVLECSICDPQVGVTPGPPVLCRSFCESVFSTCADAFFSADPLTQVLMPCGPKDVLCARAKEWASNSSQFCQLIGFSVEATPDLNVPLSSVSCFDGKAVAPVLADEVVRKKQKKTGQAQERYIDMLVNYIESVDVVIKILWAVGGLVLTAGALHLRRRTLSGNKAASVILRNKLMQGEARARQQAMYRTSAAASLSVKKREGLVRQVKQRNSFG